MYAPDVPDAEEPHNAQDELTWRNEAAAIAAARRSIQWRSPSRHEMPHDAAVSADRHEIFADAVALSEQLPSGADNAEVAGTIRGSRERGLVVHKLLEEVLTGETADRGEYPKPPGPRMDRILRSSRRQPCAPSQSPKLRHAGAALSPK